MNSQQNDDMKLIRLFSKTGNLEKELEKELKRLKNPADSKISSIRRNLRETYEEILFTDLKYAQKKMCEQLLWKFIYHKEIDAFRKLLKQNINSTKVNYDIFLEEGKDYLKKLILKLEENYELIDIIDVKYKLLINLGDLERYSNLNLETKNFSLASNYYNEAIKLNPFQGTAHNQLAVVGSYEKQEFECIYRYIRSLYIKFPFMSNDNMNITFERNRSKKLKPEKTKQNLKEKFVRIIGTYHSKINVDDLEKLNEQFLKHFNILIQEFNEIEILKFLICLIYISELKKKEKLLGNSIITFIIRFIQILIEFNLEKENENDYKFMSSLNLFLNFIEGNSSFLLKIEESFKSFFDDLNDIIFKNEQNFEGNLPEDLEIIGLPSPPIKSSKISKINLKEEEKIKLKRFFIFKNNLKKLNKLKKIEKEHQILEIEEEEEEEEEEEVILFKPMNEIEDPFNSNLNFNDFNNDVNMFFENTNLNFKENSAGVDSMIWSSNSDDKKQSDKVIKNPFKSEKNENVWSPFVSNQNNEF
eukprot:gene934-9842_t